MQVIARSPVQRDHQGHDESRWGYPCFLGLLAEPVCVVLAHFGVGQGMQASKLKSASCASYQVSTQGRFRPVLRRGDRGADRSPRIIQCRVSI